MTKRTAATLVVALASTTLWPQPALSENTTAANANFASLGQLKSDVIGPSSTNQEQWYKVRLVAGRSYAAYAWAPEADQSETPVDLELAWFLEDGTVVAGPGGLSFFWKEPLPVAGDHRGDAVFIRPTTTDCADTTGCTYRLRLTAFEATAGFTVNVVVVETTLFSAHWQVTPAAGYDSSVLVRNNTGQTVNVAFTAFDSAGVPVCNLRYDIPGNGRRNIRVGSECPGPGPGTRLTGSGSAQIAHNGPPGAVTANTTTLSAMTGLSFDAPFEPRRQALFGP